MTPLQKIDAEIAKVRRTARVLVAALLIEREKVERTPRSERAAGRKPIPPPMTKKQRGKYDYLMRYKGRTREQALAALGLGPAVGSDDPSPVTPNGCGTSPAGDQLASSSGGALSQRRDH